MGLCLSECCNGLLLVLADEGAGVRVSRRPIPFDLIDVLLMVGLAVVMFAPHVLVSHRIAAILKNAFDSSHRRARGISWDLYSDRGCVCLLGVRCWFSSRVPARNNLDDRTNESVDSSVRPSGGIHVPVPVLGLRDYQNWVR